MRQSKNCWHSYQAIFDHDRCSTQRTQGQLRGRYGCAPSRSMVADQHAALHDSSLIWRRAARRFHGLAATRPGARICPEPVHAGCSARPHHGTFVAQDIRQPRSEEHTSELQSLMRISYAVFCLKKKTTTDTTDDN